MELKEILKRMPPEIAARAHDSMSQGASWIEQERRKIETLNLEPGKLTGYDCPDCLNRGYIWQLRDSGEQYAKECRCMIQRRNIRYLRESGLESLVQRYSFDTWRINEKWQAEVLKMAREFAENPAGWFFLAGRPGTGKTHLCTAICGELMKRGFQTRYLLWRDFSAKAKALVNDEERYSALTKPLKAVPLLYIDDLFKTGKGAEPTAGDVNLAFELLNNRYNDGRKITIISSELTANRLLEIDEGLGSRVCQRAGDNYADLSNKRNYRLQA